MEEGVSALIEGAQAGDDGAFEQLVRRFYDRIYRWALARTGDRDDADDVTQEVLVRLHRHLDGFDGRSRFTTWLFQVTRSAAADLHRRRTRRARLALRARLGSGRTEVVDPRGSETQADLDRAGGLVAVFLEELSDRQREVFDLVDLHGYAPAEVGAMLGMEPVTVRSHLFRARRSIRRKVLESHPELVEDYGN
ncbi:MAG: RNA polymerase sigma factor [Gemmatimonadota bacterium]|nr:MAG: RNA polymerase sigma factor [Gemmatimonadota bacterium]